MARTRSVRYWGVALLAATALLGLGVVATPASAAGPPGPAPYPKIWLSASGDPNLTCTDVDGSPLYYGRAWTLEPLVRGPLFAPVVLWLAAAGNQPVVPLEFDSWSDGTAWYTIDAGPALRGEFWGSAGRPVGYGPVPTDTGPRVTCFFDQFGFVEYGDYTITAGLAKATGLPTATIGRRVHFEGEGAVVFTVLRRLFPLTASVVGRTLWTPDYDQYGKVLLDGSDVRCTSRSSGAQVYRGTAYTLAPLVRGYQWAPMALWLSGDRIVAPTLFLGDVSGTYVTTSGSPALAGEFSKLTIGPPPAYGSASVIPATAVLCEWSGVHDRTLTVTTALATQLGLPTTLVGRTVRISGTYSIRASTPGWLFPPKA